MDVLLKRRVDQALASADLCEGVSPWTIIGIAPSVCDLNTRRVKPGDAVHIKISQKKHQHHRYHNRAGIYVKPLKDDMHLLELSPLNTLFGFVRGQTVELRTMHIQMYKRLNPSSMTVPLLLSYFKGDEPRVLQYLRKCIDCVGKTDDSVKESSDPSVLLKNIQDNLTHPLFGSVNPWNRYDFTPTS